MQTPDGADAGRVRRERRAGSSLVAVSASVTVSLEPELMRRVEKVSAATGCSAADLMREALVRYLDEAEGRLTGEVQQPSIALALREAARRVGGVELDIPARDDQARAADFA